MFLSKFVPILAAMTLTPGAVANDSRSDWTGYDWRMVKLAECQDLGSSAPCHIFHGKWDWKRNQWVDLILAHGSGALQVEVILTNYDLKDDDYVCVVVLFQNQAKANVAAIHFNEHSDHQTASTAAKSFPISESRAADIAQIAVGTKQCRDGKDQDKSTYAQVFRAITAD
ncbi:hypothetical protein DevBK_05760 [Devosia sp. BK]|uniref:hypothetical protein n=1 Tax=Devosia sp. BK TaxID=2871706 RepID=UPI0029398EC2|nr:hypothetical protein [Devosia sp. BK]MDV3250835.1 hypothetical protein [Devosia sp. BK]